MNAIYTRMLIIVMAAAASFMVCDKSTPPDDTPIPGNGITVLTPNGGTTYYVGDSMHITWDLNDSVSGLLFAFSPNNGLNYFLLGEALPTSTEFVNKEYIWVIPDTVFIGSIRMSTQSASCKIYIFRKTRASINYP